MGDPALTETRLTAGTIVADRYRIESLLGEGGMGVVYLAEHIHMRKRVALKVLLAEWSNLPEVVARFEREAIAAGKIEHPNVARATDFGRLDGGSFFLVLEHIDGKTLRDVVGEGPLGLDRAVHIARGVALAIGAAHAEGIVHRDLKPENVMLIDHGGDPDFVKVLDFGIAKVDGFGGGDNENQTSDVSSKPLTRVGSVIGTPDYMSPEQAFGQAIDLRSDLYSLGVILFEMIVGTPPFQGSAVTVLRQHVTAPVPALGAAGAADPRVEAIVRKLLEKEPAGRFASARDLVMALDDLYALQVVATGPRAALHSVSGVTTPAASSAVTARLSLQRLATPRMLVSAGAVGVVLFLLAILVGTRPRETLLVATSVEPPSAPFLDAIDAATPPPELPPPPSVSASTAAQRPATPTQRAPAQKPAPARRTGPGGIYIPPPSQWFK